MSMNGSQFLMSSASLCRSSVLDSVQRIVLQAHLQQTQGNEHILNKLNIFSF